MTTRPVASTVALRALLLLALTLAVPAWAQRIEVTPDTVVAGEPLRIVLKGFARNADITVSAQRPVPAFMPGQPTRLFKSEVVYRSTHAGTLDLATARPVSGSYAGPDLRGLFWSMQPVEGATPDADWPPSQVRISASQGGAEVATATVTLRESRADVVIEPVGDALPGALLARLPDGVKRPAIIVLGGSEGGDWFARAMAPRLASYGYAVLGLPYYAPTWLQRADLASLPSDFVDIPVERLELARDWLAQRDDIEAGRIGLYGVSKGAEFALLASTRYDWIDAVAAIVPTDVVWEGWGMQGVMPGGRASFAWRGEPLPFVPYRNMAAEFSRMGTSDAFLRRAHDHGRADHPDRANAARIPVERFKGALMVAGGMQDAVWGSGPMAQSIAERRAAAGLATVNMTFFDAGHALSGSGWSPTTQLSGAGMNMGGTPVGTAHAQAATWDATLTLFAEALQPPAVPAAASITPPPP
jgi:hypothetical protein